MEQVTPPLADIDCDISVGTLVLARAKSARAAASRHLMWMVAKLTCRDAR